MSHKMADYFRYLLGRITILMIDPQTDADYKNSQDVRRLLLIC